MCAMPSPPQRHATPRLRALLLALGLAVSGHALLLGDSFSQITPGAAPAAVARPLLSMRLAEAEPATAALAPIAPAQRAEVQPPTASSDEVKPERPAPSSLASANSPTPVFSAETPPSVQWQYVLRQQGQTGRAMLRWQVEAGHYTAELQRELSARALPTWRSEGAIGPQGLEPQRYALQRRGRDSQATNFRREQGLISYSASSETQALPDGVQDSLSWWLQLSAIVAGDPARFGPGQRIDLPVAGLRGQLSIWHFVVGEMEVLPLADGRQVAALPLRRASLTEGEGQQGLSIEIWLDPARHHLPLRVLQRWDGQTRYELLLDESATPAAPP